MLTVEYSYEKDLEITRQEGREEGRKEGANAKAVKVILNMLKRGMPLIDIAGISETSLEEVEKIKRENNL